MFAKSFDVGKLDHRVRGVKDLISPAEGGKEGLYFKSAEDRSVSENVVARFIEPNKLGNYNLILQYIGVRNMTLAFLGQTHRELLARSERTDARPSGRSRTVKIS
ncbi:MAG: hypothetical protein KAW52_00870 [candidate division Zixibacteria bacterium]|nr:hypothetical protein [candidate division Zixibacteria bacterium]